MNPLRYLSGICLFCFLLAPLHAAENLVDGGKPLSVVRVNSTVQAHDFARPWAKKPATTRRGLGTVLSGNRVLLTAEMVLNSNYVELEKAGSGEKCAATVTAVDYEANLALVTPSDDKFLEKLVPLDPAGPVKTGDRVDIWQLESNGTLVFTSGLVTSCEVGRYALEDYGFLLYKITAALQYRDNSFSVPIIRDGRLVGLLMRFDSRSQTVEAISQPVIEHFLKAAEQKTYRGFPRAGIQSQPTRDPQLRRYLKLPPGNGGVYLSRVDPGSAAARADLQAGDTVLSVDGQSIDADGNYEHPLYGKISVHHLISTVHFVGDQIPVVVQRDGVRKEVQVTLDERPPQSYIIEPYVIDRAPKFLLLGGLLFQELSRQYLREWGSSWFKDGPLRFIYLDRYQSEVLPQDRGRIVFLSQVLPTPGAIGYENLGFLIVEKVNNRPVKSIEDFAAALREPVKGFHKIEVDDDPRVIYLDAATVDADTAAVKEKYGLPMTSRLHE